ncbi:transcription termination factor MTERF15, mitochondrial [Morus notabilis]|uniref:transcription termination factor MTERF15, mitochondrial n=1 Tax=Morus notabilis TaxID=981085 RepID=UPI000CED5B35|nr:transcription termination factor MTERF15, mitochondrial [Morus notabilis]
MSKFLHKTVLFGSCSVRTQPGTSNLGFLRNPDFFSLRWFSSSSNQQSLTVSYLINSLGFTPEAALSASKYVNFKSPEKPDKLINLFKKYGFTQIQISSLLKRNPIVLILDAEKTVLPKLEFFDAKGISWPQFAKRLSQFSTILRSSLDKQIMPSYEFLRNFLQSEEMAIAAVERFPDILRVNLEKCLGRNIDILQEHGVPKSNIAKQFPIRTQAFTSSRFREAVEEVVEMGFDAKRGTFVHAVLVLLGLSKSTWERKVNAFKKWGWSEEEVLKAFHSNPSFMTLSEDKLMACMDFFINQMGWRPCLLAKYPTILKLSLKKRVIPRCSVFQFLLSEGLVEKEVSITALLLVSEEKFMQKFVVPYEKNSPKLLKLYEEKVDLSVDKRVINDDKCLR